MNPLTIEFKTFGDTELQIMLAAVTDFASALQRGSCRHSLALLGSCGVGKTYLARQVWEKVWCKRLVALGSKLKISSVETRGGKWLVWSDWIEAQKARLDRLEENLSAIRRSPFVVIDEFPSRDTTGWASEVFERILNGRLGKPTIITSNKLMKELHAIDPRVASRLIRDGGQFVECITQDFSSRRH